ncbi:MAG: hypothetical protein U0441_25530 [Polyangiaceae bacterium]
MSIPGIFQGLARRARVHVAPSRHPLVWSFAFLALVVLVVMWREILAGGQLLADDIWTSDLLNNNTPPRAFLGAELRAGRFPLWMPGSYGGLPLVPQGEAAAMSPFTWVLYGLLDRVSATTATIAIHAWLAGAGMVLLARRFGARWLTATTVGVAFMWCGFLVEHVKHVNMHHAAAFLPWLVWAADRVRERPRVEPAVTFGVLAALQLVEGHPQISYVSAFLLVPVVAARLAATWHRRRAQAAGYLARFGGALALAGVVAFVLAGAYLLSGYELFASSEREAETIDRWEFCTRFDFKWENILTLGWANIFGDGAAATYNPAHGLFWESWLYVGVLPAIAAVTGVLLGVRRFFWDQRRRALPIVGLVALGAFVFELMRGKHSAVYAWAFRHVPGMAWFRFPQRFGLVLEVVALLVAAIAIDAARRSIAQRFGGRIARTIAVLALLVTGWDMIVIMTGHFFAIPRKVWLKEPDTARALRRIAPKDEPWRFLPIFPGEVHSEAFGAARGWKAWRPYAPQWSMLQPSTHLYWGFESVTGYTSMVPADVATLLGSLNMQGALSNPAAYAAVRPEECKKLPLKFSGKCLATVKCRPSMATSYGAFDVRYVLSPLPFDDCPGWKEREKVKAGDLELRLFENEHVLPRAYLVDRLFEAGPVKVAAEILARGDVDPAFAATRLLDGPVSKPSAAVPIPGSAERMRPARPCTYRAIDTDERRVTCDVDLPSVLVIADSNYPGVVVEIDGARAETFRAHGLQIGAMISAGHHEIRVTFRPWWRAFVKLGIGGWIVLAAGAAIAGIAAVRRRMGAAR